MKKLTDKSFEYDIMLYKDIEMDLKKVKNQKKGRNQNIKKSKRKSTKNSKN